MLLDEIMRNCLAKPNSSNTKMVCGLAHCLVLDLDEVENYRDYAIDLLDNIVSEGETVSSYEINKDKNGIKWGTHFEGELLIILGKALGLIKLLPNSNGFPIILREKLNKKLTKSI